MTVTFCHGNGDLRVITSDGSFIRDNLFSFSSRKSMGRVTVVCLHSLSLFYLFVIFSDTSLSTEHVKLR